MLPDDESQISAVRAFNRFYTRQLGVLGQRLLGQFSLSEARVLYELAHRDGAAAKEIGAELDLDHGYLSRKPLPADRRQHQLSLTAKGRQAFAKLDRSSHDDVSRMLRPLPENDRRRLTAAMAAIEGLLGEVHAPATL